MEIPNNPPQTYPAEPEKNNNTIYYVIFGVVSLLFLAVVAILLINKNKIKTSYPVGRNITTREEISPSPLPKTIQGSLELKSIRGGVVEIWADTGGADVISYDVLLSFAKTSVELVKTDSALSDFSIVTQELENGMAITGFRMPASTLNHNWRSTKLLTLSFKVNPTILGKATVEIMPLVGKRTSKFVDKQTKVYYPEGNKIEIQ